MPFLRKGRILMKWNLCYSLGVEVATSLQWLRESMQLVLVDSPGLLFIGL